MSDQQNLLNSLNTTIPDNINKLATIKQKTQDIIKYCNNLYVNQDKEASYAKTEQYVDSVFTNVIYFVSQTSVSIMDMLDTQAREIDRVNTDVSHVSSKLKQLRTIAGVEEMLKFNTPKPTLRSKKMKKIKIENTYNEKVIEGHIPWDKYDRCGVTLADIKPDLGVTESFRKFNDAPNLEAPVEDDLPPPSLDMDENGEPVLESNQSFKRTSTMTPQQQQTYRTSVQNTPPSLDVPGMGPPSLDVPDLDIPGPPMDAPSFQSPREKPPVPTTKPQAPVPSTKPPPPVKPVEKPVEKVAPPPKPVVAPPTKPVPPTTSKPPVVSGKGPPPPPGGPPPPPPMTSAPIKAPTSSSNDSGGDLASQLAKKKALKKVPDEDKHICEAPKIEESKGSSGGSSSGGGGDMMSQMLAKRLQMSGGNTKPSVPETKPSFPIPKRDSVIETKQPPPKMPSQDNKPTPPQVTSKLTPQVTQKPSPPTTKPTGPPPPQGKPGGPPPPPPGPPKSGPPPPPPVSTSKSSNDSGGDLASQLAKKKALKKVPDEEKHICEAPKIEEKGSSGGSSSGGGGDMMSQLLAKRMQMQKK